AEIGIRRAIESGSPIVYRAGTTAAVRARVRGIAVDEWRVVFAFELMLAVSARRTVERLDLAADAVEPRASTSREVSSDRSATAICGGSHGGGGSEHQRRDGEDPANGPHEGLVVR